MTEAEAISLEARAVRDSGGLGRSVLLDRLFDYLVRCTLEARSPKESEVGAQVFGRNPDFDPGRDAVVRVYVHKLRRKLDAIYAGVRKGAPARLNIPRGEYRLVLESPPGAPAAAAAPARARRRPVWIAATLLLMAASSLATWLAVRAAPSPEARELQRLRAGPVWGPILSDGFPTLIVVGDYYIFGESDDGVDPVRLVREYTVNSRADLDEFVMLHPEKAGRSIDLNLRYLPTGSAFALRDVVPLVALGPKSPSVRVVLASALTPEMLKTNNVVYVGYLSGLGMLRETVFAGSRYSVGDTYDEIVDGRTRRHYVSQEGGPSGAGEMNRDYGYFSTFRGPAGNRIVIVAGTRDVGVMQTAEAATGLDSLGQMLRRAGGADAFESLYEVDGMNKQNVDGRLLLSSPLNARSKWTSGPLPQQAFPAG